MSKVKIMTDSNSGITQSQGKELGIEVIPMPFFIDGTQYFEDISMAQEDFYRVLFDDSVQVSTSQPSPETLMATWDRLLQEYDEIVHIPMSSGISSALATAKMLAQEEYEGKVYVVDNQRISVTQRRSVLQAGQLAEKGYTAKQIHDILYRDKFESSIYIMVDTLKYLKQGGRLTAAAAALGTLLRIKPVLQIQGEKLDSYAKVTSLKQAKTAIIKAISNDFEKRFPGASPKTMKIDIAHTQNKEEAERFREELLERFPGYDIYIAPLSLSVSCHIGPGALAAALSNVPKELQK